MKRFALVSSIVTALAVGVVAVALILSPVSASASAVHGASTYHGMGTRYAKIKPSRTSNLTYHGGPVETAPAIYISWWGSEWSTGFSTGGYTSAQAQTYMTDFFNNIGGTSWENIVAQYCQGVANGTINCGSAGTHIQNLTGQLKGAWNDTTTVPSSPTQTDIANASVRLMQHFGYNANATYFVFTPHGKSMNGFATQWCAWHSVTSSSSGEVAYAYMPYQPDAGASCGVNFINGNNSYGNGYFDGFSVVGGHEYAEAETDPHTASGQYAWVDRNGSEIGDKCAWSPSSGNITLSNGHFYAVQPLWSNANSGCVLSH